MVEPWVVGMMEDFNESIGFVPLEIGKEYYLIKGKSKKRVKVTNGQYWGIHGISNFWYWKEIKANGSLGKEHCGYDNGSEGKFVLIKET